MKKIKYLIGVDEVGRGPLAGPVTVCTFAIASDREKEFFARLTCLPSQKNKTLPTLKDSKALSEKQREAWNAVLRANGGGDTAKVFFSIKQMSAKEIDRYGISICIKKLINRCLDDIKSRLNISHDQCKILLDGGLKAPVEFVSQETHIKGDTLFPVISCASILAKVHRDSYMKRLSTQVSPRGEKGGKRGKGGYAQYGFHVHKGYGTKMHRDIIQKIGLTDMHRKSFCRNL